MTDPRAALGALLDHLADVLPPPTPDEVARMERRHARMHERGVCTCSDTTPTTGEESR